MSVPRQRVLTRPSGIFLALVAIAIVSAWMIWAEVGFVGVDVFVFVLATWTISLCLHEYAHARLALRGGDWGVVSRGYLTLNPVRYAHPFLSIVLPLLFLVFGGIGLPGGAVWIDHSMLRDRKARSLVSLAGPATNLICAVLLIVPFMMGVTGTDHEAFWSAIAFLAFLQLTAALLNLLPIPGVDGGNVIEPWLNAQWRRAFEQIAPYGMIILFIVLWSPRMNVAFFSGVNSLGSLLGLPDWLASVGYGHFKFWTFS